ncbi:MAG: ABC transporter ATP-binding protein [Nanoarchaeota archaeon]|nr:ABC transporter ATP-binding protein [Nanoarchaeota archaeon]
MLRQPLINIEKVSKSFGKKKVLDNLTISINEGEILGLLGRSGCGKSTLIKILVGYHKADSGRIIFNGKEVSGNFNEVKKLVGYTTQENSFYEKLTIQENMNYYAQLYSVDKKHIQARINKLLKDVKLDSHKDTLAGDISGGMKRRLDFAISLLHEPKLVILDEPTTGLDPILVDNFWGIIRATAKEQKITVLISSHMLTEIEQNCDRAAIIADGKIRTIIDIKKGIDLETQFRKSVK